MSNASFNEISGCKYKIGISLKFLKEKMKLEKKQPDKEDRTVINSLQKMHDYLGKVQNILKERRNEKAKN